MRGLRVQLLLLTSSIAFLSDDLTSLRMIEFKQFIGDEYVSSKCLPRTSLGAEWTKVIQQMLRHPFLHSILSQKTGKEAGCCAGSATRF
ncbi:hypothetical protein WB44_10150 [Synechococcus sp. WH 8020]|nr:hypothetical protein WB44_10150 [Synechococcus sp. WH 8020]